MTHVDLTDGASSYKHGPHVEEPNAASNEEAEDEEVEGSGTSVDSKGDSDGTSSYLSPRIWFLSCL